MTFVGIDVSKAKLDVAVKTTGKPRHLKVENAEKGFTKLVGWLAKYSVDELHVCLEATSTYGVACAVALSKHGIKVSVVNPALVKAYAESELRRNKTDKLDAILIADFCEDKSPRSWTPPSETEQRFTSLYRRWETLKDIKAQELNRLESERCEDARVSITSHIHYLDEQLTAVEAALDCLVEQTPQLQQELTLLSSIPGVGKATAYLLMAEVDFQVFTTANQLVAFAGLNPKHNQSGNHKGKVALSRKGSSRLRKGLYFSAITARQHNPLIRPLCLRLEQEGKCALVIVSAAMRKLLHLAFGVIKTNTPFDPHYLDKHPTKSLQTA